MSNNSQGRQHASANGTDATRSASNSRRASREKAQDDGEATRNRGRPDSAPQAPPPAMSDSNVANPFDDGGPRPSPSSSAGSSPADVVSAGAGQPAWASVSSDGGARRPGGRRGRAGRQSVASSGGASSRERRGPGNSRGVASGAAAARGHVARSQRSESSKPRRLPGGGRAQEREPDRRRRHQRAAGGGLAVRAQRAAAAQTHAAPARAGARASLAGASPPPLGAVSSSASGPPPAPSPESTGHKLAGATIESRRRGSSRDSPLGAEGRAQERDREATRRKERSGAEPKSSLQIDSNANSTRGEPEAKINSFKSRDGSNLSSVRGERQPQERSPKLNKVNATTIKGSTLLAKAAGGKLVSSSSQSARAAVARKTITTGKATAASVKQQEEALSGKKRPRQSQSQFSLEPPSERSNNNNHHHSHQSTRQQPEAQAFLSTRTLANNAAKLLHTSIASSKRNTNANSTKQGTMADQAVIDKLEAGYAKLQASTPEQCHSLLKKYLTREVLDKNKTKKTAMGATLLDVAQSGFENLDSGVGIYAPDAESYTLFADLFNPIIEDYHGGFKATDKHPQSDFGDINTLVNVDPTNEYVISTRVRCGRSLKGYPFNPCLTEAQYKEMEQKVSSTLKEMSGDLAGTYYPLTGMTKEVQQQLIDDHFLFKEGDRFLQHANACRYWPTGRGIYHNVDKTFLVWVNEEDHLRIISMQKGGDLKTIYDRLVRGAKAIEAKVPFSRDDRLGFLTFCPTNLGTTIRASVHIKLPKLAADRKKLEEVASRYNLQVRGTSGEHTESVGGVYDISNKRRLGLTEYQAVREMQDGILELIKIEKSL